MLAHSTLVVLHIFMLIRQATQQEVSTPSIILHHQSHFLFFVFNFTEMVLHYGDLTDASSLVRLVTEVCNYVGRGVGSAVVS